MRLMLLAAVCGMTLTMPAAAQDAAGDAKPVKEKKTCRTDTNTGSIMPRRICHTQAEWAAIEKRNAADNERYSNERNRNNGNNAFGSASTGRLN